MAPVIEIESLRKTYGRTVAVDDVSFEVESGEIFGLLGPNGAGKTTTVECLQGLRTPDGGRLRVLGLDPVTHAGEVRRRIGCQLQESALPDRIRVWEALDLFAAYGGRRTDWRVLMEQWGLTEKRTASFANLSGGQRQRLLVALALVNDPEVVFLDEMTTGLDPASRHVAWDLIRAIRERGATVVLVTHFMDEAETLCDRLAVVDRGRVVALGAPVELIDRHAGLARVTFSLPIGADRGGLSAAPARDGGPHDLSWLQEVTGVENVTRSGPRVTVEGVGPLLALVAAALVEHGHAPLDLAVHRPSLEDVFLALTGRRGLEVEGEE